MSWDDWREKLYPENGGFHEDEGARLYYLASQVPPPYWIVELGSFHGYSAMCMAAGSLHRPDARIACIDTWGLDVVGVAFEHIGIFLQHAMLTGLIGRLLPLRMHAHEAVKIWPKEAKIGLLHIDASHDYHSCIGDANMWMEHLMPGARVAFHDYEEAWPGVMQAVNELKQSPQWGDWHLTRALIDGRYGKGPL